jgi:hypothetical protein
VEQIYICLIEQIYNILLKIGGGLTFENFHFLTSENFSLGKDGRGEIEMLDNAREVVWLVGCWVGG